MYLLYSFLLSVGAVVLFPYLVYLVTFKPKYRHNLGQRFGFLPESFQSNGRETIWVHAVSVGETLAAQPLIDELKKRLPDIRIVISTTTATGQAIARDRFGLESVFQFPLDFASCVRRALSTIRPAAVILMESELWPRFIHECKRRRIPVIIGNGRMSDRSFRGYQRMTWWSGKILANVTLWLMQSPADAERIRALGISGSKIQNVGNLKYDLKIGNQQKRELIAESVSLSFGLNASDKLIIAGSTTTDEEPIILDAFRKLRKIDGLAQTRLMIVPRHPERFDEVAEMIKRSGFSLARRSLPDNSGAIADVLLLDTIGELAAVFPLASVVFIGGSLVPKGGHNILEPAACAKPVVVGPHMENFRQVMKDFTARKAVVPLDDLEGEALVKALAATLGELMLNEQARRVLGERAQAVIVENRGAAERCADQIIALLDSSKVKKIESAKV